MLYGRDLERAQIGALLEAARDSQSGALVVRGEPGIGKSALLDDARDRASDFHVLDARGVESESELPFAALDQLLRPALTHVDRIPPPQASALRSALGMAIGDAQHERFLVFAGCLSLLAELSERRPVLCVIDDAHWLDAASADALRFVARRLHAEGVAMLFGAREGDVRRFDAGDIPSLNLAGLSTDAATALLARGGVEPPPTVRDRLLEHTRGNALALMEMPAALNDEQLAGREPIPDTLPMTRQVEQIFLDRVRRLSDGAQRLLLVAATDDTESAAAIVRAGEALGVNGSSLNEVERAHLVAVSGDHLEFRHPLVRSAVYEGATSGERRDAHRALAAALEGADDHADRRAWHLASSALEHDDQVVAALDEAAARAAERGAHAAASRALERAAELSDDGAARGRRLVDAAVAASRVGADEHAAELARAAQPLVDDPLRRAAIVEVIGSAEYRRGRPADGYPLLLQAATELADADPRQALELLMWTVSASSESGIVQGFHEAYALGSRIEVPAGDAESELLAAIVLGCSSMATGSTARAVPLLQRAMELGAVSTNERHAYWASTAGLWMGDDAAAEAQLARAISLARDRGAVAVLVEGLGFRSALQALTQNYDAASLAGTEALQLSREVGIENHALLPLSILAAIAGLRGKEEECRRLAAEAYEIASSRDLAVRAGNAVYALALLDLSLGRFREALDRLDDLATTRPGFGDQFFIVITARDRIEAAVRAGQLDKARASLPVLEQWAGNVGAGWALRLVATARALVSEGEEATRHFEQAIAHGGDSRPHDRARTQLLYGEHLRRQRRKIAARDQLRAALETFEALGTTPWAERARADLRASGETARKRDPSTASQLTPQERQIAGMVAEGMANKEIAAQLYLSPRTIDAHLRNVFSKLGVTSRTQLARHVPAAAPTPVPA